MKERILKILLVISLIVTMTSINLIFIGHNISIAVSDSATNVKNVEFNAYFKNDKGEKVSNLDIVPENLETSLFIELNVKQEGYINGTIDLQDANFKVKSYISDQVKSLDNNIVTLNQINAGSSNEIELKIEFNKEINNGVFDVKLLNKESSIILNGIYRGSEQKDIKLKATKKVTLNLISDVKKDEIVNNLKIITNKILKINGEDKRVVQLELETGLKNNNYPIKSIYSEVTVPVINDKQPIVEKNVVLNNMTREDFNYEGNVSKINMFNDDGFWKDSGNEKIILTYIYEKDVELDESKIEATQKAVFYDEKENIAIPSKVTVKDSEECDAVISANIINEEDSIYKGKLYSGIDRQYKTTTKIDFNLVGVAKYIEVDEESSTYVYKDKDIDANTYYIQTKLNKNELIKVFGENIKLIIADQNGNVVSAIDSSAETDEQGNIVVNYKENEVKKIIIKAVAPEKVGTINVSSTKVIKQSDKKIIKAVDAISNKITQKYNIFDENSENSQYSNGVEIQKEQKIELKETSTETVISMNKNSLSTLNANNVEISVILKSNSEANDLYKNPRLQIILPQEIEDIKVNSINKLYADEFEFSKARLTNISNVGKVIDIELAGEQSNYLNEVSQGIQIVINADITFNKSVSTRKSSIFMKYTNENGANSEYETKMDFDIVSKYGMFVYSTISGYDENNTVLESTTNENVKGELNLLAGEKVLNIERNIINNYEYAINGVNIVGRVADIGQKKINNENLQSTFSPTLEEISINIENAKIYYSEKSDISSDSQEWQETVQDITKVKSYKIELPENTLKSGENAKVSYKIRLPGNLQYNESTYENVNVSYNYNGETVSRDYATYLSTLINKRIGTIVKQQLVSSVGTLSISAVTGGEELKDGQEIFEGQTVKETLALTNNTGSDLNNVKITVKQDNGTFYNEKVEEYENTLTGESFTVTKDKEDETIDRKEYTLETLKSGESTTYEYEFSVKEKQGENTKGTIILEADGINAQTVTTLTNPIKEAKLKLNVDCEYGKERRIISGSELPLILTTKNISDIDLTNVVLEIPMGENLTLDETEFYDGERYTYAGIENGVIKINIPEINAGEIIEIFLSLSIDRFEEDEIQLDSYYRTTVDNNTYVSNYMLKDAINPKYDVSVSQTANINDDCIKTGDTLVYTANIKNLSNSDAIITIMDNVPDVATIQSVYTIIDGEKRVIEGIQENSVLFEIAMTAGQTAELVIETLVDESLAYTGEISNKIVLSVNNKNVESNVITHKLSTFIEDNSNEEPEDGTDWSSDPGEEPDDNNTTGDNTTGDNTTGDNTTGDNTTGDNTTEDNTTGDNTTGDNTTGDNTTGDNTTGDNTTEDNTTGDNTTGDNTTENGSDENYNKKNKISGVVWLDKNRNGKRDNDETLIEGINIKLFDYTTGKVVNNSDGQEESTSTNNKGEYQFTNVANGRYMLIIEYDTGKYALTEYKKSGIGDDVNSDVISKEIMGVKVAVTDEIQINDNDIENLDAGLVENKIFDLKLNKYINKVVIQNPKGTKVTEYNKAQLAKVELDAKQIANTTVLVEYRIDVTNEGEIAGYANEITDYIPDGFKFNSEINKSWYTTISNNSVHNASIASELINPGETKTMTITLIKNMTENNVGTAINTAEISKSSNEFLIEDKDSIEGNKATGEDDIDTAEVIISIRTGAVIIIGISVAILLILAGVAFVMITLKRRRKENE